MPRITTLVTGAGGFIGTRLCAYLKAEYPNEQILTSDPVNLTEEQPVAELVKKTAPDKIFHLAGLGRVTDQISFKDYFESNTLTTAVLLNALSGIEKPVRFFLASTMHVYGNPTEPVDETSLPHPLSPYAYTKYLAEETLRKSTQENAHIQGIVARLYSCFGPGQPLGFVASDLCHKVRELPKTPDAVLKTGPLGSYRRFIDVRDVVKVFPALMNLNPTSRFEIFNVASQNELRVKDLLDILLKLSGKSAKIVSTESTGNVFQGIKIDMKKLERAYPTNQFRKIEETLSDMLKEQP